MNQRVRFAELLERHQREIHRFAFRMTGDRDDAEDVLQETFLRAFRAFPELDAAANHRAWLYKIALRQAINLRRAARVRRTVGLQAAAGVHDPRRHGLAAVETRGVIASVAGAVQRLSARQRAAWVMRVQEGLPYGEVAAALGCSEDSARANVYQANKRLRTELRRGGLTP